MVVGVCLLVLFLFVDQSLQTSCLPMTILAQLYDCHSCYDERSLDQKKKGRRMQARPFWKSIQPNWPMIKERVWTATGLPYTVLQRHLSLHEFTEESRWLENSCKGANEHRLTTRGIHAAGNQMNRESTQLIGPIIVSNLASVAFLRPCFCSAARPLPNHWVASAVPFLSPV